MPAALLWLQSAAVCAYMHMCVAVAVSLTLPAYLRAHQSWQMYPTLTKRESNLVLLDLIKANHVIQITWNLYRATRINQA